MRCPGPIPRNAGRQPFSRLFSGHFSFQKYNSYVLTNGRSGGCRGGGHARVHCIPGSQLMEHYFGDTDSDEPGDEGPWAPRMPYFAYKAHIIRTFRTFSYYLELYRHIPCYSVSFRALYAKHQQALRRSRSWQSCPRTWRGACVGVLQGEFVWLG